MLNTKQITIIIIIIMFFVVVVEKCEVQFVNQKKWPGLGLPGLGWAGPGLLAWPGLGCLGLAWAWDGLGWPGLALVGLCWFRLVFDWLRLV